MWSYTPPIEDSLFVINELLQVQSDWQNMPPFRELDEDLVPQILQEAGKFSREILLPINASGDSEGCRFADGEVSTPCGFIEAYRRFCSAGWPTLACAAASGGQGLPQLLNATLYEMLNSANHAWTMYPGVAHGAYECIRAHGSEALRDEFLAKIVSGEWLATMCLTEPQAGTDLGLIRTLAVPERDGTYSISGTKIFISGGEHDLTTNIIHLVLARLPDAPSGTRGLSLFVVPKFTTNLHASQANGIRCDGIEKKMGIKGSATCVMRFEAARGWLVGTPHRGLSAMFTMMNAARLHVGLQGLGHAEIAYQNAARYSRERLQMRTVTPPTSTPAAATPIAFHPAVRRVLATSRALVEGGRALALWTAHLLDVAEHHSTEHERGRASQMASLLTPIVKAFLTDNGFTITSAVLQVWGGYGYVHDFGIEQSVRDSRIAMIYEGTNEIQAIDLLVRKIIPDDGTAFELLLHAIRDEAAQCSAIDSVQNLGACLQRVVEALTDATRKVIASSRHTPELPHNVANDFLRAVSLTLLASLWARAARIATDKASTNTFYQAKLETAQYYFDYILPEIDYRLELTGRGDRPLPLNQANS